MPGSSSRNVCGMHQASRIPHLLCAIFSKRQCAQLQQVHHTRVRKSHTHTAQRVLQHGARLSSPSNALPRSSSTALPTPQRARLAPLPEPLTAHGRKISTFLAATALFGFSIALYVSYGLTTYSKALKDFHLHHQNFEQNVDVSNRYNDLGRDFDEEVELSEKLMFMGRKRMRVCREATGRVLEVSCGTGRNMSFYDLSPPSGSRDGEGIESLTFNDKSIEMMEVAKAKWERLVKKGRNVKEREWASKDGRVQWVVGDVGIPGALKRPEGGFDTIVQTMGVCSVVDAVGALRQLGRLVRQPGEKSASKQELKEDDQGGRIMLLEHGRGYYDWMNRHLDSGAAMHADHYGCWWNKDIGRIIRESGLKVESIRRYHLGTTWEVALRPHLGVREKSGGG